MRDRAGNTLALVAAGLIPLLGLIGGGVDMSRIYLTKTRMQQACDAGALAGRRMMGAGAWNANNNAANSAAVNMYNGNFQANSYGSTSTAPTYSENSGTVSGTASATLPMTIMKVFGQTSKTITVNCTSEMAIPNTDVMFVLDTTGSMADCANGSSCNSNSNSKIAGLKKAVKCFYEALAKIDTDADCGSTPTGSNAPGVQLRFGFMPYATNVNVGKLLPNGYLADNWTYQSRKYGAIYGYASSTSTGNWTYASGTCNGSSSSNCSPTTTVISNVTSRNNCKNLAQDAAYVDVVGAPSVSTASDGTVTTTTTTTRTTNGKTYVYGSYNSSKDQCSLDTYNYVNYKTRQTETLTQTPNYRYDALSFSVSGLKAGGSSWNDSVSEPVGTKGASVAINWDGCIEERQTIKQSSYDPIDGTGGAAAAGAKDLNIDLVPSSGDATTQWGPALPGMIFARDVTTSWNQLSYPAENTTNDYYNNVPYYCPVQAKKLQVWSGASAFDSYVDSLYASGNTYHDIGILWGARFMSPTGIFASENAFTPTGGTIQRHMIFMSDGDTNANNTDYAAYGLPWLDRRETSSGSAPSGSDLNDQVNARYSALCTAIKNKGITLWVISYGVDLTSTTQTRMQACASPGKFFAAADTATLISNFQQIANNISQLRLTQ